MITFRVLVTARRASEGSPSESEPNARGTPSGQGAKRPSPRGSPVVAAQQSPRPRPGRTLRSSERPGGARRRGGPKGNPERQQPRGTRARVGAAIYALHTPSRGRATPRAGSERPVARSAAVRDAG